jgi:hypothetical protein
MSFFNSLPIFFLLPVMTIFSEVPKHLAVKQYNCATCYITENQNRRNTNKWRVVWPSILLDGRRILMTHQDAFKTSKKYVHLAYAMLTIAPVLIICTWMVERLYQHPSAGIQIINSICMKINSTMGRAKLNQVK